ncbi:MAG: PAS domain S-box protein [Gemmatimonadales bacterium]|nr:MAG: PAS domain S-box protein [Gemmatimonadales bacterium]
MLPPPLPPDEPERLGALRSYGVLDSEPEGPYDEITALAALICEAPFSMITLVDEDRQWFKSRQGWAVEASDRAISFCAHTILGPDILVVPDAAEDPRFADNPSVRDSPGVRFYAGAPLVTPEGQALGSLCVVDLVPRTLTADQVQALRVLRNQVMTLLELRRKSRRLDLSNEIVNSLPGVFYLFDGEGRFLRWNRQFQEVTGYSHEEVARLRPLDLFRGADRTHIAERIRRVFESGSAEAEAELVGKDGKATPHLFSGRLLEIDGEPCLTGMGIDVSRRQEIETERERLFNLSRDPFCMVAFDGTVLDVNPAWADVVGQSRESLVGRPFMESIHPADRERTLLEFERNLAGSETGTFLNRYRHHDGSWRWFSWTTSIDFRREIIYGTGRDVTEEREAAEALRKSEERYRTVVESARDAMVILAPDGTIASVNRAFETITGWPGEAWLGRPHEELLLPEDLPLAREVFGKMDSSEAMPVFELRVVAEDGEAIPMEIKAAAFEPEDRQRWAILVARDIRSRKALDERLGRVHRLDAVGRLAAGIAHDFSNVLGVVRMESALLLQRAGTPPEFEEGLRHIHAAAEQGVDLTGRLMALSRKRDLKLLPLDLNEAIERFLPMLRKLVRNSATVSASLSPEPSVVLGDGGMLEQVFMNLAINASDAMPGGGAVVISTARVRIDEQTAARYPNARSGPYCRLSVSDTGTGIDPRDLPRIFEPLFTTKAEGEGTGLGLATVFSIVRQHAGWLDVETEPGRGTTFHLFFPAMGVAPS